MEAAEKNSPAAPASTMRWYAVQTYSSFENKVKQGIEHKVAMEGVREQIDKVIIPTETVIEVKNGKKRQVQRSLMPGYVLVYLSPSEELFNLIKDVKGVASFVGDGHSPTPLEDEEISNILNIMEDKLEKPKPKVTYRKGDQIKVIDGPFADFVGNVEEVDQEKGKLKVMVSIFGRPTPVELDVMHVENT